MITTVTMNPCIDRSVHLSTFNKGATNRVQRSRTDIGGKGINVSVQLRNFRQETRALCLDPMDSGTYLTDMLTTLGVPSIMVPVNGRLRENLKIYDDQTGDMTEINEAGVLVDFSSYKRFMQRFSTVLMGTDILVLSGSIPPGIPAEVYREMITAAKAAHVLTVLDAAGDPLRLGIEAGPDLIKPNRYEMETLTGHPIPDLDTACAEAMALVDRGVGCVCLSMGAQGAILANRLGIWYSEGVPIKVVGEQGAGDSLVAGLCMGKLAGMDYGEMLRTGMVMAQGSLTREGTLLCTQRIFDELKPKMPVTKYRSFA